jgi:hypothetical protein
MNAETAQDWLLWMFTGLWLGLALAAHSCNSRVAGRQGQRPKGLFLLAITSSVFLSGCAIGSPAVPLNSFPPWDWEDVQDLRGQYRDAVCKRLASERSQCENTLLRLPGEPSATLQGPLENIPTRYRVAFVPGLFSECFEGFVRPFMDVEVALRGAGFTVDYIHVPGRGSVAQNALHLSKHFIELNGDARPTIVFAHSKGLIDILEFVVRFPHAAKRIAAVVGIAGAANGSPFAETLVEMYRDWGATFPLPHCAAGTGEEVYDLRRDVRLKWWQQYGGKVTVPVFSLVATPRPDHVSPAILVSYRRLAQIDPRNDGKLLWHDQIAPGSRLLGFVNADHWTIAIPISEELPGFSFLFRDRVLRTALIEGAIEVVADTLADRNRNESGHRMEPCYN